MKRMALLFGAIWLSDVSGVVGQETVVAAPESLVVEGVPNIPASLAESTEARYFRIGNQRNAAC